MVARYGTGQDSLIGSGRGALLALSMTRYTEFVPRRMILADMIVRVKPEFYAEAQLTMELVNRVCETPEEIDRIREAEGEMLGIDVGPGNRPSLQRLLTRGRNGYEISCDKTLTFALDLPLTFDQSVALRATQVPTLMIYGRGSSYFDELLMDQVTSLNKNVKCIPNIGPFETVTFEDFHIHSTILGFLATRRWGKAQ